MPEVLGTLPETEVWEWGKSRFTVVSTRKMTLFLYYLLIIFHTNNCKPTLPHPVFFFFFRERGEEREKKRERNIHTREKHRSVASLSRPDWGRNQPPTHVPWQGIELVTFHFAGWCPTNRVTPGRAHTLYFLKITISQWVYLGFYQGWVTRGSTTVLSIMITNISHFSRTWVVTKPLSLMRKACHFSFLHF